MRLLITPGESAGIGPDIVLAAACLHWDAELIVIADPSMLAERAKLLNLPVRLIEAESPEKWTDPASAPLSIPGTLRILPVNHPDKRRSLPGKLEAANVPALMRSLDAAAHLCLRKKADAVITGPVHKGIVNEAGFSFTGHTEWFAAAAGVKSSLMLFVLQERFSALPVRVALATTHLPLAKVPQQLTHAHLAECLHLLHTGLQEYFSLPTPRIRVLGLNPHAGESGYLGHEETAILVPLIHRFREKGFNLEGPVGNDTAFLPDHLASTDALLAMYHDAALPVVKYMGQGHAVNVTLGLPFIRTSVDHGVALDKAGTGKADPESLFAAIRLAVQLASTVRGSV